MIEYIYKLSQITMDEPLAWGEFHWEFLVWVAVICTVVGIIIGRASDKFFRFAICAFWLVMLFGEVLKQITTGLTMVDGEIIYKYDWAFFPFQLCSTPLYVLPVLSFLKDGRIRDYAASYIIGFGLIGGLAVYLVPDSVFCEYWFSNMHSMIHHGIQIITGIMTAVWYKNRITKRFFFKGCAVFAVMFTVAMLLNTVFYKYLIEIGQLAEGDTFNMFLISPYVDFDIPVFTDMFNSLSPWAMITLYFFGVPLGVAVIMNTIQSVNLAMKKDSRGARNAKGA